MTKTLFFFTALCAMLAAMTAVLIRTELAQPGISPLFALAGGAGDGAKFGETATLHALLSYLAVMLLGTTMISAARAQGAKFSGFFLGVGIVLLALTAAFILAALLPDALPINTESDLFGIGWELYPPLSTNQSGSLLDVLLNRLNFGNALYFEATRLLMLPAAVMIYLGAFALLSTQSGFRWVGLIGFLVTLVIAVFSAGTLPSTAPPTFGFLFVSLLFLGCAAVRLVDDGPLWLLTLALGALVTTIALVVILVLPNTLALAGTIADPTSLYVFPLGLAWFALPALIMYRHGTRLSETHIWGRMFVLTLTLTLWIAPLFQAGMQGQPMGYVDYPDAFANANLLSSLGLVFFISTYVMSIALIRRNRA